jgi:hypothetical protein
MWAAETRFSTCGTKFTGLHSGSGTWGMMYVTTSNRHDWYLLISQLLPT